MSDALRWILPSALLAVGALVGVIARGSARRRASHAPLDLSGLTGRVIFFSDAACTRCDIVRAHLEGIGVEFQEVAYDTDPDVQRQVGVTGVPLVVLRAGDGTEVERFAGVVAKGRLSGAIRSAGIR